MCTFHKVLLLFIRLRQVNLFDVTEYCDFLKAELKRTRVRSKTHPYENDYSRKLLDPEYGISYIKTTMSVLLLYLFLTIGAAAVQALINSVYWFNSLGVK